MSREAPWVRIPPSPPADTATAVSFDSSVGSVDYKKVDVDSHSTEGYAHRERLDGFDAAETFQSRQVREEAAVRRDLWVPSRCRSGRSCVINDGVEKEKGRPVVSLSQVVRIPDVDRPALLRPLNQPSVRGRAVAHCHRRGSLCPFSGIS